MINLLKKPAAVTGSRRPNQARKNPVNQFHSSLYPFLQGDPGLSFDFLV